MHMNWIKTAQEATPFSYAVHVSTSSSYISIFQFIGTVISLESQSEQTIGANRRYPCYWPPWKSAQWQYPEPNSKKALDEKLLLTRVTRHMCIRKDKISDRSANESDFGLWSNIKANTKDDVETTRMMSAARTPLRTQERLQGQKKLAQPPQRIQLQEKLG